MMELKATYWHHFEEGNLTADGFILLNEAASHSLDQTDLPISDWELVKNIMPINSSSTSCFAKMF